jgi:hypothetical protein
MELAQPDKAPLGVEVKAVALAAVDALAQARVEIAYARFVN